MNRSTHPVEPEEVMAYLDGELPAQRAADLALHLEQCRECQALAGELRLVSQQVAAWQVEPPPERLAAQVTAALEEPAPAGKPERSAVEPPRRRPLIPRWVWGFASGLGVLLILVAISVPNLLRSRMSADRAALSSAARPRQYEAAGRGGPERIAPYIPAYGPPVEGLEALPAAKEGMPAAKSRAAAVPSAGAMIIRTASLVIVTKEFENARAVMELTVRRLQGYIAHLGLEGRSGTARVLTATLRVPVDRLDAALAELRKLGRVEEETQSEEEVTQQYVDLVARLSNARNTEQRLIQVLRERTGKVADILAVEKEIARVREEIERMEAQRKSLEKLVAFARIQVRLTEEHKAQLTVTPPSTMTRLWNDLVAGFRSVGESAVGLLASLLRYGPSLLFWFLLLFWPARYLWRRLRAAAQSPAE